MKKLAMITVATVVRASALFCCLSLYAAETTLQDTDNAVVNNEDANRRSMGRAALLELRAARGGTYYGLHIGINKFNLSGCETLHGCVNDANGIYTAYTDSKTGLCSKDNAYKLLDSAATKSAIRKQFNNLAKVAKSGDVVFYSQSSHGGAEKDFYGNYTKTAYLCAHDSIYTDVEFAEDVSLFADGVRVVVFLDTCHSEGMFRTVPGKPLEWNFASNVESIISSRRAARGGARIGWIAAAAYNEFSQDASIDNSFWGAFTYAFLEGWKDGMADEDGNGELDYWELFKYARANCYGSHAQYLNEDVLASVVAAKTGGTIAMVNKPNLEFVVYGDWPSYAFLSSNANPTEQEHTFEAESPIYLYSYFRNNGANDAPEFTIMLQVVDAGGRGVIEDKNFKTPLVIGQGGGFNGRAVESLRNLPAGQYTLKIILDSENVVDESDETDNVAVIPFTIVKKEINQPTAPDFLSVEANGGNMVVSWNAVSGASSYRIYRSTTASKPGSSYVTVTDATVYCDKNVDVGTTYYYWVSAVNEAGEGAVSGPKSGEIAVTLTLSGEVTRNFDMRGGKATTLVTTTGEWSATADKSWVSVSPNSGTVGKTLLTIIVGENSSPDGRSAVVTISSRGVQRQIQIEQSGIPVNPALGVAVDNQSLSFRTGGASEWVAVSTEDVFSSAGSYVRSGTLAKGQTGWIETTVTGTGTLQFRYSLSAIYGGSFKLFVDGTEVANLVSATGQWKYYAYTISSPGIHSIRWVYEQMYGLTYAMLDDVSFGTGSHPRLPDTFTATSDSTGVSLHWSAISTDVTKCNLYRATSISSTSPECIKSLVPSETAYTVSFTEKDTTGMLGVTYYYWVEAVNVHGSTICAAVAGQKENAEVVLGETELSLPAYTDQGKIKVSYSANMDFYIKADVDWIDVGVSYCMSFASPFTFSVTTANTNALPRYGKIMICADAAGTDVIGSLTIIQEGMPRNPTPQTWYVDAATGDDENEGTVWATAKKTIQGALDVALSGDTIIVNDGCYGPFEIRKMDIHIKSVNGASRTTIQAPPSTDPESPVKGPVAYIYGRSNIVEGFRLDGRGCFSWHGGCVQGGTFVRCVVTGGVGSRGGGANGASLVSCLVFGNSAETGGGTYGCALTNCTVFGNCASSAGGGTAGGSCVNSIIWGNTNKLGEVSNWSGSGSYDYCCTIPLPGNGRENIDTDPLVSIVDGLCSISDASPCLNSGNNAFVIGEFDLLGRPRIGNARVDRGAVEDITVKPSSPNGVVRTASVGGITLDIPFTAGAVSYNIYRSTMATSRPSSPYARIDAKESETVYIDKDDVVPGAEYWYWVSAVNEAGESAVSSAGKGWSIPALKIGRDKLSFPAEGGLEEFDVTSDAYWVLLCGRAEFTMTPASGTGSGTVAVSADRNSNASANGTVLAIIAGFGTAHPVTNTISIVQDGGGAGPCIVRFDANGGQGEMDSRTFISGTEQTLPKCTFVRTGYKFAGWGLEPNGEPFYSDEQFVGIQNNMTIYALWVPNEYTVQFNSNIGGVTRPTTQKFTYGVSQKLDANPFSRQKYDFSGWATSASGTARYKDQDEVINLTSDADAVVQFYAVWTAQNGKIGPWGDDPIIWDADTGTFPPTILWSVNLTVDDVFPPVGSCVAGFDSKGIIRAFGMVEENGNLDIIMYAAQNTKLRFKVWVAGTDESVLRNIVPTFDAPAPGSDVEGIVFSVADSIEQELSLSGAGWHLVSFNVMPDDPSPATIFADVSDRIEQVVHGSRVWRPGKGGRLTELSIGTGYWVKTSADEVTWSISGTPQEDVLISLDTGWNLIGYPLLDGGATATVLGTAFGTGKVSKIVSGAKVYPGRLLELSPGLGYWVYASEPCTISFDGH